MFLIVNVFICVIVVVHVRHFGDSAGRIWRGGGTNLIHVASGGPFDVLIFVIATTLTPATSSHTASQELGVQDDQRNIRFSLGGNKIAVQGIRPEIAVVEVVGSAGTSRSLDALADTLENVGDVADWAAGSDREDGAGKRAATHGMSTDGVSSDSVWA